MQIRQMAVPQRVAHCGVEIPKTSTSLLSSNDDGGLRCQGRADSELAHVAGVGTPEGAIARRSAYDRHSLR